MQEILLRNTKTEHIMVNKWTQVCRVYSFLRKLD